MQFTPEQKKLFDEMSVVILSPITLSDGLPKWFQCTVNMVAYSWQQGLRIYEFGHTYRQVVDWARNELGRAAREYVNPVTGKKFTHVLWLDSDHTFNPDLACCLARHMVDPAVDAVSAVYYNRTGATLPVIYVKDFNEDKYKHFTLIWPPEGLFECDAVGFGAILMKRDIFDRVPEPWFTLDYRSGEDIAFCVKAKEHGVRFFVDGDYTLGHIGEGKIITKKDYLQHLEDNKDKYKDKIKVTLGGKPHAGS